MAKAKAKSGGKAVKKSAKKTAKNATTVNKDVREWTAAENKLLDSLNTPLKIQKFVDGLHYDPEDDAKSVRRTLQLRVAHCLGGALLAAHCLERHGYGKARIIELRAVKDDGHVLAVYQRNGLWGALGKSNFTCIRARDTVYSSLRELVMSYHDFYFNTNGEKSLRGYTEPLSMAEFDKATGGNKDWLFSPTDVVKLNVDRYWPTMHSTIPGLGRETERFPEYLLTASKSLLQAGLLGSNPAGLYKPKA